MPCESAYLAASGQEQESKRVCDLLVYVYKRIGREIPEWVSKAANYYYGNVERLDEATALLCGAIRSLTEAERETIVFDAHKENSRKLATWWETHQEWDKRRKQEEDESRKNIMLKDRAIQKLTCEEREALGL